MIIHFVNSIYEADDDEEEEKEEHLRQTYDNSIPCITEVQDTFFNMSPLLDTTDTKRVTQHVAMYEVFPGVKESQVLVVRKT